MKDCIVIGYSLRMPPAICEKLSKADLILIGRRAFPSLNYKRELSGHDHVLCDMAGLSKRYSAPVAIEVLTDNYGAKRRSAAVFEDGKLLAIADATRPSDKTESPSSGFKVIKLKTLKAGLAISKDVKNIDCLKALSLCESDVIINLYADIYDYSMTNLVPAVSYLFGTSLVSLTEGRCIASNPRGGLVYSGDGEVGCFTLPIKKAFKEETIKTFNN